MATNRPLFVDIGQGLSLMLGLPTVSTWETGNRPKDAKVGTFGFNSQTKSLEYWNGRRWLKVEMSDD